MYPFEAMGQWNNDCVTDWHPGGRERRRYYQALEAQLQESVSGRVVSAQTIRQSVLTSLLKAGHDLSVIQGVGVYRHPGSTDRCRPDEVATLAAAVLQYHPFG